jgi:aspartate aminotransferase
MEVSSTLAMVQEAERLRRAGYPVIDFGPGEPDFPTPANIKAAAQQAINDNFTRYTPTPGSADAKKAVIDYIARETGTRYETNEVMLAAGGKQTLFNAIMTLINPGDEVLIAAPYWVTFPEIVKFAEGQPVIIDTTANQFQLTAEMVAAHITPRTRLLIVNSPSNPSGRIIAPAELEKIVQVAAENNLWVISDECYYRFTYAPHQPFSAASLSPDLRARVLVSGSCSKTYAMTGWRIGYVLGDRQWIGEMNKVQGHATSNACSISQAAAIEALTGDQASVDIMLAEYRRRRDFLIRALNAIDGVSCIEPEGAFYAFPNISGVLTRNPKIATSAAFAQYLIETAYLVLTPGSAFGCEGYARISYATDYETLQQGVARLAEAIAQLPHVN